MAVVLVLLPPTTETLQRWAMQLRDRFDGLTVVVAADDAEALRALAHADAAYGTLPGGFAVHAPRLAWLQAPMAAPPVGYFSDELAAHPVVVTNMRGVYNDHIATHVLAFLLAFARGLPQHLADQRQHRYRPATVVKAHLADSRVLLVGAGGVGRQVARYLAPFGPKVVAVDAKPDRLSEGLAELHPPEALDEQLPLADFVVMTVPHTPATEGLMDRARLARMKPTAVLINIGRGMTVRLDDLVAALDAGELAGAGLDVLEQEPLPAGHPLWDMANVMITPHVAIQGPYLNERRYEVLAENCGVSWLVSTSFRWSTNDCGSELGRSLKRAEGGQQRRLSRPERPSGREAVTSPLDAVAPAAAPSSVALAAVAR